MDLTCTLKLVNNVYKITIIIIIIIIIYERLCNKFRDCTIMFREFSLLELQSCTLEDSQF